MGGALSAPVDIVRVQRHGSRAFRAGAAEMQGWRSGHEDAHDVKCGSTGGSFWVLDGHGGDGVALEGAPKLGDEFFKVVENGKLPSDGIVEETMARVDAELRQFVEENPSKDSGSTVVGALCKVQEDGTYNMKLINCGDSRGVIVRGPREEKATAKPVKLSTPEHLVKLQSDADAVREGYAANKCEWPVIQESVDHKPSHPTERARIEAAGGFVTPDDPPRLDGNLAVSRGFGDFEYKQGSEPPGEQKVSCIPDIYEINGIQPGSILALCCDGVWDVLSGQDVALLVRDALEEDENADLGELAAQIIRLSLDRDSRDNITAMVVHFADGSGWGDHQSDELVGYEKVLRNEEDQDVKSQASSILRKWNFPQEPITCAVCGTWRRLMFQCPVTGISYCGKRCQKKDWKARHSKKS